MSHRWPFLLLICGALFGTQRGVGGNRSIYVTGVVKDGGIVRGIVTLHGPAPVLHRLAIAKDERICGQSRNLNRIVLGKNNGVKNAVVYLENVSEGKAFSAADSWRKLLDQRKCEYDPHVLLVPYGESMTITNSDAVLHNVHAYDMAARGRTSFNIAQPIRGQRTNVKPERFKGPGFYEVACDAGHPWMSAHVVVAGHPYYAITDVNGRFELTDVPPGAYRIRMWHEGVRVIRTEMDGKNPRRFIYEEPYMAMQEVVARAASVTTVEFSFSIGTQTGL
jgi:plastocyanin